MESDLQSSCHWTATLSIRPGCQTPVSDLIRVGQVRQLPRQAHTEHPFDRKAALFLRVLHLPRFVFVPANARALNRQL